MPQSILPSFSKGELAPALHGRVDTQAYATGLRIGRNAVIHNAGGASNRPGLYFIGPAADMSADPRLIRFKFSDEDTYQLEFGDETMRVIREDGYVLETAKTITGITQANPGVVTIAAHGWANGTDIYIPDGGGMTELEGRWFIVSAQTTNTFALLDKLTGQNLDTTGFTAWSTGGTAAKVYEIATPYATADLPYVKFTQSADVMTLAHTSYPTQELSRNDHDDWTLEAKQFGTTTDRPQNMGVAPASAASSSFRYTVTAIDREMLSESVAGMAPATVITAISATNPVVVTSAGHTGADGKTFHLFGIVGMEELNGRDFRIDNVTATTFELVGEDGTGYTPYVSGGAAAELGFEITTSAATPNNTITWNEVTDAVRYAVYREQNGLYGFLGETTTLTFTDNNITPDMTISPPVFRDVFNRPGEYPGAVGYYEQRLVLGGTNSKPDTEYYSRVGDYGNFTSSTPTQDDDAITKSLASSEINTIQHFLPGEDNLVFTSGSEWRVNSGGDAAFTPSSHTAKEQSKWGTSHVRPLTIGDVSLFVQKGRRIVRSIGYSFSVDKYTTNKMSLLAAHLFSSTSKIREWDFASSPDPLVFTVLEDGRAACLTFDPEQEVVAWTRWDTKGKFRSVSVSQPTQTDEQELPYFVVQRTVGGNTVRYVERLASRDFTDVRDAYFVDCGITYDVPVAITGATAASPVVVTAAGHGLTEDDLIDISDITWVSSFDSLDNETQPEQLRGRFKVGTVAGDTFEVLKTGGADVDGTAFAAYVEGGYVRKAVSSVGGLWHLEGEEVIILADGNVVTGKTVSGGAVALPRASSRVHVGLKYIADVETLNIESAQGTIQARTKNFNAVTVRMEKSRGIMVGPTSSKLSEFKQRELEALGDPTALLTGDLTVKLETEWRSRGRLFFRQRYPLPMTILAVIPDFQVGDG